MKKVFSFTPKEALNSLLHNLFEDGLISLNEYQSDNNKLAVIADQNGAVAELQVKINEI